MLSKLINVAVNSCTYNPSDSCDTCGSKDLLKLLLPSTTGEVPFLVCPVAIIEECSCERDFFTNFEDTLALDNEVPTKNINYA